MDMQNPAFQMTEDEAYPPTTKPPVYENFDRNVRRGTSAIYNVNQPPTPSKPDIPSKTTLKCICVLIVVTFLVCFLLITGVGGALYYKFSELDQKVSQMSPVVGGINGNSSGPAGPPGPQGIIIV